MSRLRRPIYELPVIEQHRDSLTNRQYNFLKAAAEHGGKYEAIAAAIEVPLGTVRSRFNRARNAMEKALAAHTQEVAQ